MAGTWAPLTNGPGFNVGTMLLLTDGSIMCQDNGADQSGSSNWYLLTPNPQSALEKTYTNGQWWTLPSLPPPFGPIPADQGGPTYAPLDYASAVLRDGRVFITGGEYNGFRTKNPPDVLAAAIYDPVSMRWTTQPDIPLPPGWSKIGDAPCCVLPDGRVLLGSIEDQRTAIYDPVANTFLPAASSAGSKPKDDSSGEETWTLLPDNTVLTVECSKHDPGKPAEKYVIASDTWVSAGALSEDLVDDSIEIGPAILLPDGRVFAIGATGATGFYTMPAKAGDPGTWTTGKKLPSVNNQQQVAKDAPACLLPNGRVLIAAGPQSQFCSGEPHEGYCPPTSYFEFDPQSGNYSQLSPPPNDDVKLAPYSGRMLLLPTGQVLFANSTQAVAIYTPDGSPKPAWRPTISSVPQSLRAGQTYTLQGIQLNGLSQACSYGDDATMATNYPLVRIRSVTSNTILYCRTASHSTMAVATGNAVHSTQFTVPQTAGAGAYELVVIANGIASDIEQVTVAQ